VTKSKSCYFLSTFRRSSGFNMDFDRRMLEKLGRAESDCFWRIYSWDPPAVSIGKNQNAENILDVVFLIKAGIPAVKRPTGGRAIYHKKDICISAAGMLDGNKRSGTAAKDIYLHFADVLISFFDNLKTRAILARGPRLAGVHRSGVGKLPCFLSATPYELMASGKKIAGIALYVGKDRFLVQSSIRVGAYELGDFALFRGLGETENMFANVTSLEEESGRSFSEEEMRKSLIKALAEVDGLFVVNLDEGKI
jgi:lipoate-protein ligase A